MVKELPVVVCAATESRYGRAGRTILEECILDDRANRKSLAGIATILGISKQAVQVKFRRTLNMFREIIERGDYRGCRVFVRREFLHPLRALGRELASRGDTVIAERTWDKVVRRTWDISASEIGCAHDLILMLLGWRMIFFESLESAPVLVLDARKIGCDLEGVGKFIERTLKAAHPAGVQGTKLFALAKTQFQHLKLTTRDMEALSRSMKYVSRVGKRYSLRPGPLISRADLYEFLLIRSGKPLHYRSLVRLARPYGYRGNEMAESVANILTPDRRFVPVGHSGYWALAAWPKVETRSCVEIAHEILSGCRRPLTIRQLFHRIGAKRPLKRKSIRAMLSHSPDFECVDGGWRIRR